MTSRSQMLHTPRDFPSWVKKRKIFLLSIRSHSHFAAKFTLLLLDTNDVTH